MVSYQKLLLTAREQAETRLGEKGLGARQRKFVDEAADPEVLMGQPLVSRPDRQTESEVEDDFMTSYYNKLYAQNQELKNQIQQASAEVMDTSELATEISEGSFEGGAKVGKKLKQDIQEIFGLEDHQAAAIAGNLAHETGDFKFMQELQPLVPGSKGGYGFAQWTGPRRVQFEDWSKENKLDPSSYEANLGFLVHEFQTDDYFQKVLGKLEATKTVDEAAKVFSDGYLKPGIPKMSSRLKKSRMYLGQ